MRFIMGVFVAFQSFLANAQLIDDAKYGTATCARTAEGSEVGAKWRIERQTRRRAQSGTKSADGAGVARS
jgi:hypothetical protein